MKRQTRPVSWVKAALKEFRRLPERAQSICLTALTIAAEGGIQMKNSKLELVRGSGNVFHDLGHENADVAHCKAIIEALDRQRLTVRAAHNHTGYAAADFSRIRNADLGRFTVDRLVSVLNLLGSRVELTVQVRRDKPVPQAASS